MVVEHTSGSPSRRAYSLPQTQMESATTQSGRNSPSSRSAFSSMATVTSITIAMRLEKSCPIRRPRSLGAGGRKASQGTNSAPAPSSFARNSSKE